jgi:hypothetical protein
VRVTLNVAVPASTVSKRRASSAGLPGTDDPGGVEVDARGAGFDETVTVDALACGAAPADPAVGADRSSRVLLHAAQSSRHQLPSRPPRVHCGQLRFQSPSPSQLGIVVPSVWS